MAFYVSCFAQAAAAEEAAMPCLRILPAYGSMAEDVAGNENGKRTGKAATVHE